MPRLLRLPEILWALSVMMMFMGVLPLPFLPFLCGLLLRTRQLSGRRKKRRRRRGPEGLLLSST
jgi:hypothetical protein